MIRWTKSTLKAIIGFILFVFAASLLPAQTVPAPDPLFQTIQSLDTKLFTAYNQCDLETLGSFLPMILSSITIRLAS